MSKCQVNPHELIIEESEPEWTVNEFVEVVDGVLKGTSETDHRCPPIYKQDCIIRCVAKTQSKNSISLLAGKVSNVLDKIEPFGRPPLFFGVRFRFPPFQIATDGNDEPEGEEDFVALRFETWENDVECVWMEVSATNVFTEGPVDILDKAQIRANIKSAYDFLTNRGVGFINQFDSPDSSQEDM